MRGGTFLDSSCWRSALSCEYIEKFWIFSRMGIHLYIVQPGEDQLMWCNSCCSTMNIHHWMWRMRYLKLFLSRWHLLSTELSNAGPFDQTYFWRMPNFLRSGTAEFNVKMLPNWPCSWKLELPCQWYFIKGDELQNVVSWYPDLWLEMGVV